MQKSLFRTIALSFSIALAGTSAVQASDCKGLQTDACSAKASCSWVEGYERKDGRQVKSFCRSKPAAKQKAAVKPAGKSMAAKTTK